MNYLDEFISDVSALVPVAAGLYYFKRLKRDRRWILYFLIYTALVEFSNAWMASRGIYNLWQMNLFSLIEYSFFIALLNKWIKSAFMLWLSLIGSVLFFALWLGYLVSYHDLNRNYSIAGMTENIILMLLTGFALTTISLETERPVRKNYRFWFSGISFIYFAINVLMQLVLYRLIENPGRYEFDVYIIHTIINILVNVVYAYTFYLKQE